MQTETEGHEIKNSGANPSTTYVFLYMVQTVLLTNSEAQTEGDIANSIDTAIHRRVSKHFFIKNIVGYLSVFIELGTSGRAGGWRS